MVAKSIGQLIDKLICWKHPYFVDQIISELDQVFLLSCVELAFQQNFFDPKFDNFFSVYKKDFD